MSKWKMRARSWTGSLMVLGLVAAPGCGTVKTSNTPRTGTEQLLLTNAWDTALQKVDFRPLTGVPVYLETGSITAIDQGWVTSSLRQAMLTQGVLLRAKPEQAQWIVEARVGAYGTDEHSLMIGLPQTTVPATIPGIPAGTIPEMPLVKKSNQQGLAKLALFAYDRASGQFIWSSGTVLATSSAKDTYIGGVGPIQGGSIREGTEFIGIKLPVASEANGPEAAAAARQNAPSDPSALRQSVTTDLDSFKP